MLDTAIEAAKAAGEFANSYFKTQLKVSYKPDDSPVTRADIEAEKLARKIISKKFPDHGIIGEELKNTNPKARLQWVIDPIDGTRDFVRGSQFWATLIAVLDAGQPIIGVIYFPTMDEVFVAEKNKGCYFNDAKTRVSRISKLNQAYITFRCQVKQFFKIGKGDQFIKISQIAPTTRSLSAYSFSHLLRGKADINIDAKGKIWDFAAPAICVEEAGGKFSDFEGKFSLTSDNGLFSNGLLHDQVLKILK